MSNLNPREVEVWAQHPDFPLHEISSFGRVRQVNGRLLRGTTTVKGYKQVRLNKADGSNKLCWIHRLVLETFIGPCPPGKYESSHEDGSKDNNRLDNLDWISPADNQRKRQIHGTSNRGIYNPRYIHGGYVGSKGYFDD